MSIASLPLKMSGQLALSIISLNHLELPSTVTLSFSPINSIRRIDDGRILIKILRQASLFLLLKLLRSLY